MATDDAEGSVILHPSYLVWLESLGGSAFAEAMADRQGADEERLKVKNNPPEGRRVKVESASGTARGN